MKVSLVHMQTGRRAGKEGMGKEGNDRVGKKEKRRAAREKEEYKIG